jgi:glycosyltransferase involved in cell wall biosynthesis
MAALAHRKAIVTTPPAIPLPLFKNGVNMVWPERDDAKTLAATVYTVLKDKNFRRRLEDGAAALVKHFNWAQIALNTRAWLAEISRTPPKS